MQPRPGRTRDRERDYQRSRIDSGTGSPSLNPLLRTLPEPSQSSTGIASTRLDRFWASRLLGFRYLWDPSPMDPHTEADDLWTPGHVLPALIIGNLRH